MASKCKVMPERGRILGLVQQSSEVVDVLDPNLVVKGGSDQLQGVGPQLDALLQRLIYF